MLERDELRNESMKHRLEKAEATRKKAEEFINSKVMGAVYEGRTSVKFKTSKLRLLTFGDQLLLQDLINSLRGKGLTVYVNTSKDKNKDTIEVSWD